MAGRAPRPFDKPGNPAVWETSSSLGLSLTKALA